MSGAENRDARCYWPAGLEALSPAERAAALERGYWLDGSALVLRSGLRLEPIFGDMTDTELLQRAALDPWGQSEAWELRRRRLERERIK